MRYRLDLAYDGTDFRGWAKQPNFRTVQGELEIALSKVLPGAWGSPVPTVVAGRTDTGVHARAQVVHFDWAGDLSTPTLSKDLLYRLRAVLPPDIVVYSIQKVNDDFSARFWAKTRTYKYRICDDIRYLKPEMRSYVYYTTNKLDVRKMNKAVQKFTGLHDFATFSKPRAGATTTRNLLHFKFKRVKRGADKGLVVATLKADAFAYNMVRSLVGAAVLVGSGKRETTWMYERLQARVREGATGPIAAKGLTLERIEYIHSPKKAARRAEVIRARR